MSVRHHPTKKGWWIIDFYPEGKKRKKGKVISPRERIPFKGNKAEALQMEMELRRQHRQGKISVSPYIRDAVPDFLASYKNDVSENTFKDFHFAWKHLSVIFANLKFTNLIPLNIAQYKSQRLDAGVKKRTVNKELSYLRRIISWGEENGYSNPLPFRIRGFKKKYTKAPLPDVPTPEEMHRLIAEVNPTKRVLALLFYHAGLRLTEATNLRRDKISLDKNLLCVKGKGDKERLVPISTEELRAELKKVLGNANGTEYLIVNPATQKPYKDVRLMLKEAAKRAGVSKRVYAHLLRHAYGTHGAEAGVDPRAMQRNLGHSTMATTEIYTHLAAEYQKKETEKLGAFLKSRTPGDRK